MRTGSWHEVSAEEKGRKETGSSVCWLVVLQEEVLSSTKALHYPTFATLFQHHW